MTRLHVAWCLAAVGVAAQPWPDCQEQGVVLRHSGAYGLFVDLTVVGAREGCYLSDCTRSDKYMCPSAGECAAACANFEACKFWTFEPIARKCYLRVSDGGRERNPDFVAGVKTCAPGGGVPETPPPPGGKFQIPFAQAALWAAELPAIRSCDGGIGAPGCDNPYAAMGVWRYAVNNLRQAIGRSLSPEVQQNAAVQQYVQQVSHDVSNFYKQPTPETFNVAVQNGRIIFDALRDFLRGAPGLLVELPAGVGGAAHLPGGRSAKMSAPNPSASIKLANGHSMPLLGFGTWQLLGQACYDSTIAALQAGYRHIDTAQAYGNEREVGLAWQHSGVPRRDIFLVTKLSEPEDYMRVEERVAEQLRMLGTDYLDLYMLHTPGDTRQQRETAWRSLEALHDRGVIRSLGVSNHGIAELRELFEYARIRPVYVQNKFSVYTPGEQQIGAESLLAFCREHEIAVMGYSVINPWPLLLPPMDDPHVAAVAGRYGRTPAQVLHRWALQQNVAVVPRSQTPKRIAENAQLFDFELSELDMRLLSSLATLSESDPVPDGKHKPPFLEDAYGLAV